MILPHACLANDNAPRETTVGDLLVGWARRTPYRVAIADVAPEGAPPGMHARRWTFEALRDDAATLAVALLSRYEPGERIALWAPMCPEGVVLLFAAAFAGLVVVTIDPALPAAEMARILDRSGSAGLFVMSERHGRRRIRRGGAEAQPLVREIVDLADRRSLFAKHRCVDGLPEVRPGDPAEIRYSGRGPAGETLLHRDLADMLRGAQAAAGSLHRAAAVA